MLLGRSQLSEDDRALLLVRGWCAYCPKTGAYLNQSAGRRKAGAKLRFYLHHPLLPKAKTFYAEPFNGEDEAVCAAQSYLLTVLGETELAADFGSIEAAQTWGAENVYNKYFKDMYEKMDEAFGWGKNRQD